MKYLKWIGLILAIAFCFWLSFKLSPGGLNKDIARLNQADKIQTEVVCRRANMWCNTSQSLNNYNWACGAKWRCDNTGEIVQADLQHIFGILHAEEFAEENSELLSDLAERSNRDNPPT